MCVIPGMLIASESDEVTNHCSSTSVNIIEWPNETVVFRRMSRS